MCWEKKTLRRGERGMERPADKYACQPTDSVMSFHEQLAHIDWILNFHTSLLLEYQPLSAETYRKQLRRYPKKTDGLSKEAPNESCG